MFDRLNRTARALAIVVLIVLLVMVLQLYATLAALYLLASIAFFLAIAFFIYLNWRERRGDIATWSLRLQLVFYGGAMLIVLALGWRVWSHPSGLNLLSLFIAIAAGIYAMVRAWRAQHRYN